MADIPALLGEGASLFAAGDWAASRELFAAAVAAEQSGGGVASASSLRWLRKADAEVARAAGQPPVGVTLGAPGLPSRVDEPPSASAPPPPPQQPLPPQPSTSVVKKKAPKDWAALEKELAAEEAKEVPAGDDALNKLFKDIYSRADEDTRRAMTKSYVESGGTCLSTDWKTVGVKPVPVEPPAGMEARKYGQ